MKKYENANRNKNQQQTFLEKSFLFSSLDNNLTIQLMNYIKY